MQSQEASLGNIIYWDPRTKQEASEVKNEGASLRTRKGSLVRYVLVGSGGHGKVLASIARRLGWELIAVLDDGLAVGTPSFYGTSVQGPVSSFAQFSYDLAFCLGIGDNETRAKFYGQLKEAGRLLPPLKDPSALMDENCALGEATVVMPGVLVNVGVKIGPNCILNTGCNIDVDSALAETVHVGPGCKVGSRVTLQMGVFLGIGAIIQPGITIGQGSIVGAGALVTNDVPPGKLVVGRPAG